MQEQEQEVEQEQGTVSGVDQTQQPRYVPRSRDGHHLWGGVTLRDGDGTTRPVMSCRK